MTATRLREIATSATQSALTQSEADERAMSDLAHGIWGGVAITVSLLASTSFDQWVRRRYPLEQSVFKKGNLELRVGDSAQLLPLAKACGMIPETAPVTSPRPQPEAKT